jgi:hypothetical protein
MRKALEEEVREMRHALQVSAEDKQRAVTVCAAAVEGEKVIAVLVQKYLLY